MICHCGKELFRAPVLMDDSPVLVHESGHIFHGGHCFETNLTLDEIETLALVCSFLSLHPSDVQLQAERYFDGKEFRAEDVQRILERMKQIGHRTRRLQTHADEGE